MPCLTTAARSHATPQKASRELPTQQATDTGEEKTGATADLKNQRSDAPEPQEAPG